MLTVVFSQDDVNLKEGFVLQVLVSPPGTIHPFAYVTHAHPSDPATRVAVKVTGMRNSGEKFSLYPRQPEQSWKAPMRLNAVFDWFSGASLEQIAVRNIPRRYLYISKKDFQRTGAMQLADFVQGGFTDSSLSEQETALWAVEQSKN